MEADLVGKQLIILTINKRMTYLYIKEHNVTGLRYFGKTKSKNLSKYHGSGKRWVNHMNKHGRDVNTIWSEQFDNQALCTEFAEFFSEFFDIVASDAWANLKPENGIDGGSILGHKKSHEARAKMSKAKLGKPSGRNTNYRAGTKHTEETIAKMKLAQKGVKNHAYGTSHSEEYKAKHREIMKQWWADRKAQKEQE